MSSSLDSQFDQVISRLVDGGFITERRGEEIKMDHAHILECARKGDKDDWSYYCQEQWGVMATAPYDALINVSRRSWSHEDIKLYKIWSEATRIHNLMVDV